MKKRGASIGWILLSAGPRRTLDSVADPVPGELRKVSSMDVERRPLLHHQLC